MSRPTRITAESVERNIRAQREVDVQRQRLAAFGKETANLVSAASSQNRIEVQRRMTQQQMCQTEQQYEASLQKSLYDKKLRELTLTQNQALAGELDKDSADEERRRREIQKICEEAPELKELEKILKVAYLNKERAAQYEEKILIANREQERIQAIEDQMEYERLQAIKADANKDYAKKAMFENQRAVLQKQIDEKKQRLLEARRQIEKERDMVDDIVNRINQEDEAEYRGRKEKQAATAEMVRNFELQRKRELEAARLAAKAEEDRILAYNRAVEARSEGVAAKKQAKKDEDNRILAQIVEETERKRRQEEEFNSLRDMLWEEELEAKRAQDAHDRRMKQEQMRREMMDANSHMLAAKDVQRHREAEKEARLVAIMRQKFAEDDARERAEEENRRNAKLHHMSLIERQRHERQHMYEAERAQESAAAREAAQREEYRQRVIQEARKRLLEEHAAKLAGYMPSKAFESRDELEAFRQRSSSAGRY